MYVYRTTNLVNNKKYIGVCVRKSNSESYLGSGVILKRAIKKYGKENFKKDIIKSFKTEIEARNFEKNLIEELNAIEDENYYNLVPGGYGGGVRKHPVSEETKKRISKTRKERGLKPSLEMIERCSKIVLKYDLDGSFIQEFKSKKSAGAVYNTDLGKLSEFEVKFRCGFLWKFKSKNKEIELNVTSYETLLKRQNIATSKQVGKLTESQVQDLLKDRELGLTYKELRVKYHITESCICDIVKGKTYQWVKQKSV